MQAFLQVAGVDRQHLFRRPNFIISRVCGQMAVVFGQLPHVGTVGRQRDGRVDDAVGTTIAGCPPHGPGRALISASGSYLG